MHLLPGSGQSVSAHATDARGGPSPRPTGDLGDQDPAATRASGIEVVHRVVDRAERVGLREHVPQAKWEPETTFADDVPHLGWKATGGARKVENGVDTFIFTDGMIRVQTVVYTVQPA